MTRTETRYFALHIRGIGYLNRIREVKPTPAEPFWANHIAVIFGSADRGFLPSILPLLRRLFFLFWRFGSRLGWPGLDRHRLQMPTVGEIPK